MAKAKNWKRTSFIFRDSRLNAFNKMEWDAADIMKALKDYRTLGFIPEDKYKPYIYSIVEPWINELEWDKEDYEYKTLANIMGWYITKYWFWWQVKFKEAMLKKWYSEDILDLYINRKISSE